MRYHLLGALCATLARIWTGYSQEIDFSYGITDPMSVHDDKTGIAEAQVSARVFPIPSHGSEIRFAVFGSTWLDSREGSRCPGGCPAAT
jgi:hypothetical protein